MTPRYAYRPELTGLRALAALLVMFLHYWAAGGAPRLAIAGLDMTPLAAAGWVGVDLFFVLSGFLLARTPLPALTFWRRRARRILPAFLVQLVLLFVIGWWLLGSPPATPGELAAQATLTFNLWDTRTLNPVYWSLPVEWDFYLLFPLLAVLLRRHPWRWTLAVLAGCVAFRLSCAAMLDAHGTDAIGYARWIIQLPARLDEFLFGMLAAQWLDRLQARWGPWLFAAGAAGLLLIMWDAAAHGDVFARMIRPRVFWYHTALGASCTLLVMGAALGPGRVVSWPLRSRPLQLIGTISYSLYLWHLPIVTALVAASPERAVQIAWLLAPVAAAAVSWLSWRFVERPFLRTSRSGAP